MRPSPLTPPPTLRVARPTARLQAVTAFYRDGLGLDVLSRFEGHDGFDGVILGRRGWPYHLEFTASAHDPGEVPSKDHLLVFYLPDLADWQAAVDRLTAHGVSPVAALNPYWDRCGQTFEDPDGYRVVLCRQAWPASEPRDPTP